MCDIWGFCPAPWYRRGEAIEKRRGGGCLRADHGMGREGALSKECQALTNLGLAPDTPDTWNLVKIETPRGACSYSTHNTK